jgi:hypothetical protein
MLSMTVATIMLLMLVLLRVPLLVQPQLLLLQQLMAMVSAAHQSPMQWRGKLRTEPTSQHSWQ